MPSVLWVELRVEQVLHSHYIVFLRSFSSFSFLLFYAINERIKLKERIESWNKNPQIRRRHTHTHAQAARNESTVEMRRKAKSEKKRFYYIWKHWLSLSKDSLPISSRLPLAPPSAPPFSRSIGWCYRNGVIYHMIFSTYLDFLHRIVVF